MKRQLIILLALCLCVVPAFGVSAQDNTADLTALAEFAPANTVVYTAFRTDAEFIATLDGYAEVIGAQDGIPLPEGMNITTALDMIAGTVLDGTFEEKLRPWLGDTAALVFIENADFSESPRFFYSVGEAIAPVLVAETTDPVAAATLLIPTFERLEETTPIQEEVNGIEFTVFVFDEAEGPNDFSLSIAFLENHIIFGNYGEVVLVLESDGGSLADSEDFQTTVALLPGNSYNAIAFGSQPNALALYDVAIEAGAEFTDGNREFYENVGSGVVGAIINDGTDFTLEGAVNGRGGETVFSVLDTGAVNFDFASNITNRFPAVIHQTNLARLVQNSIEAANEIDEGTDEAVAEAEAATEEAFGLTLEEIYGWMVNDYALVLGPSARAADASSINDYISESPIELGILIDATADEAAALTLVDAIEQAISDNIDFAEGTANVALEREENVVTVTVTDLTATLPFQLIMQFGLVDGVFVLGTPGVLMEGTPLTESETFAAAAETLIENPANVYYLDFKQLAPLLRPLEDLDPSVRTAGSVLGLLDFATISSTIDADGNGFVRAVIALQ